MDFFCREFLLAVEIDGDSHRFKGEEDLERQQELEKKGIEFLRFEDLEVKQDIDGVVAAIKWKIRQLRDTQKKQESVPSPGGAGLAFRAKPGWVFPTN